MIHGIRATRRGTYVLTRTNGPDEKYHRYAAGRIPSESTLSLVFRGLLLFLHLATVSLVVDPPGLSLVAPAGLTRVPALVALLPATAPLSALLLFSLRPGRVLALGTLALVGGLPFVVRMEGVPLTAVVPPEQLLVVLIFSTAATTVLMGTMSYSRRVARRLLARSYADPVSKLPNRYNLLDDIGRCYAPALALVKAERFTEINSCFGYSFGEEYLVNIRGIIETTLTNTLNGVSLYHVDRDTFAILEEQHGGPGTFTGVVEEESVEYRFRRIVELLREQTFSIQGLRFPVPVTAGIATGSGRDPVLLYNQAEQALIAAVYSGRSEMFFSDSQLVTKDIVSHTNGLAMVSHAIQHDGIEVVFQPIMKNRGSTVEMYEALVRIRREDGTLIPPGEFLFATKLSTYHADLTRVVFEKSFAKMSASGTLFTVNISMENIADESFLPFLEEMMGANRRCRDRCVLELTESEGISNFAEVEEFIEAVAALGYRVAIDDFGSGYSNFANVVRLPVDYLKFDGQIVQAMKDDPRAVVALTKMNEIAKELKIKTVAEFVDSKDLLTLVRKIKIDYSQGFLIGAPSRRLIKQAKIA